MSKLIFPLGGSLTADRTSAISVTLITQYWTLGRGGRVGWVGWRGGVGRKNSFVILHCSRLCLWKRCIRARQNSFNCRISPGYKKIIFSSLKLIWKQTAANRAMAQHLPSFLLHSRNEPVESEWAEQHAGQHQAGRASGIKPRYESCTELVLKPVCGWKLPLHLFKRQKRLYRKCVEAH